MDDKIKEIICEKLDIVKKIKNKDNLILKLGMDSLGLISLKLLFEDEFLVEVPVEKIEKWETVQDIINTIKELKDGRN